MPAMEYTVSGPNGQGTVDDGHVVDQLTQMGYQTKGVSPDGLSLTMTDNHGDYQIPVKDALGKIGYQVSDMKPVNADYTNVQPEWRAAVNSLPDDDTRQAYILGKMKKAGQDNPLVMGTGRDWHVFNPQTKQWVGVTNDPGSYGTADLAEGAIEGGKFLGSAVGGAGGAALGAGTPASIPAAMAGSAVGSGAVDAAERAIIAARDPEYRSVISHNMGKVAGDVGWNAGVSALTTGAFKGAPALVGALGGKEAGAAAKVAMQSGPLSTVARGTGAVLDAGGDLAGKAAKLADNQVGRGLVAGITPGLSSVNNAGWMLRLPQDIAQGAVKGAGALGENATAQRIAPSLAQRALGFSKALSKAGPDTTSSAAEKVGKFLGGPAASDLADGVSMAPTDIFRNAAQGTIAGASKAVERRALVNAFKQARQFGMPARDAFSIGKEAAGDIASKTAPIAASAGNAGARVGSVVGKMGTVGRGLEHATESIAGAGIKGVRGAALGARAVGKGLNTLGTVAQPLENQAYLRYGAEELLGKHPNPWRKRSMADIIDANQDGTDI